MAFRLLVLHQIQLASIKTWSRYWGLGGVLAFLLSAVWRVLPAWQVMLPNHNDPPAYLALSVLLPAMIYLEGHRGFYKGFAPRVISRCKVLPHQPGLIYHLLAPLFCMGFIGSTPRRKMGLALVTFCIVGLVLWAKSLSQPWRWVVDISVAVALFYGVISIVWLGFRDNSGEWVQHEPELPGS